MAFQFLPGATAIGISFSDGVTLAAERRVSYGNFVINKHTRKIFPVTESVGAACAGMIALIKIEAINFAHPDTILETRRNVAPNSIAKLMSVIMFERRFFPLLTQIIVGGVDTKSRIYTLDPLGSVLPDDYASVGTGAEMALGVLDSEYKSSITAQESNELALKAIRSSVQRDSASGDGVDLLTITKGGQKSQSFDY